MKTRLLALSMLYAAHFALSTSASASANQCAALFHRSEPARAIRLGDVSFEEFRTLYPEAVSAWASSEKADPSLYSFRLMSRNGKIIIGVATRKRWLRSPEEFLFIDRDNYERGGEEKFCSTQLRRKLRRMKMASAVLLPVALVGCADEPTKLETDGLQSQITEKMTEARADEGVGKIVVERFGGVWREKDGYVIDKGHLFRVDDKGQISYIPGTSDVESLLLHKNTLFITADHGYVYVFREAAKSSYGRWIQLTSDVQKLFSDGQTLFAIFHSEAGWISSEERGLRGYFGEIKFVEKTETISETDAQGKTTTRTESYWTLNGERSPLRNLKLPNITDLYPKNGELTVKFVDGSTQDLKSAIADERASRHKKD